MTSETLRLLLAALVVVGLALAVVFGRIGMQQYEATTERERELRVQADALRREAEEWRRRMGKDPEQIIGRVVWEEFPDLIGTQFQSTMLRAVAERQPMEHLACYEPTGAWIEQRVVPLPEGVVTYARDVTERIRLHD